MVTAGDLITAVRDVLAGEPHVRWAYVFGSVARGGAGRDVDVALMPAAEMPRGAVCWGSCIARLEAATGRAVDLVDLGCAAITLLGPMLCDRVVVVDRDRDARVAFEAAATMRWLDFKPCQAEAERIRVLAMQRRLRGAS
jgi:predicted nucleotidyltransferase